jgi:hypothetical protein
MQSSESTKNPTYEMIRIVTCEDTVFPIAITIRPAPGMNSRITLDVADDRNWN